MTLTLAAQHGLDYLAAVVPDPGDGVAPPFAEKFLVVLRWAKWVGLGLVVLGVIGAGVAMAIGGARHGDGSQHMAKLGWCAAGAVAIGGAVGMVGLLA